MACKSHPKTDYDVFDVVCKDLKMACKSHPKTESDAFVIFLNRMGLM